MCRFVCRGRKNILLEQVSLRPTKTSLSRISNAESSSAVSFSKFVTRFSRPREGPRSKCLKFIRIHRRDSGSGNRLVTSIFRSHLYFTLVKHCSDSPRGGHVSSSQFRSQKDKNRTSLKNHFYAVSRYWELISPYREVLNHLRGSCVIEWHFCD